MDDSGECTQAISLLRALFSCDEEQLTPLKLVQKVYEDNADMISRVEALKLILNT